MLWLASSCLAGSCLFSLCKARNSLLKKTLVHWSHLTSLLFVSLLFGIMDMFWLPLRSTSFILSSFRIRAFGLLEAASSLASVLAFGSLFLFRDVEDEEQLSDDVEDVDEADEFEEGEEDMFERVWLLANWTAGFRNGFMSIDRVDVRFGSKLKKKIIIFNFFLSFCFK